MERKMDEYNPLIRDMQRLKVENERLEAQLKEKSLQVEQEVTYKMEERKKNDNLRFEIDTLKKRVDLSQNINHQLKAKLINIAKDIVEIYGKEIKDKTKH
jgi:lipopolysaccharide export system protein LptC|tara:strand:- start:343 stop:642 length:300 start_codon:yes stop_codon:yes gene_type:complete